MNIYTNLYTLIIAVHDQIHSKIMSFEMSIIDWRKYSILYPMLRILQFGLQLVHSLWKSTKIRVLSVRLFVIQTTNLARQLISFHLSDPPCYRGFMIWLVLPLDPLRLVASIATFSYDRLLSKDEYRTYVA